MGILAEHNPLVGCFLQDNFSEPFWSLLILHAKQIQAFPLYSVWTIIFSRFLRDTLAVNLSQTLSLCQDVELHLWESVPMFMDSCLISPKLWTSIPATLKQAPHWNPIPGMLVIHTSLILISLGTWAKANIINEYQILLILVFPISVFYLPIYIYSFYSWSGLTIVF